MFSSVSCSVRHHNKHGVERQLAANQRWEASASILKSRVFFKQRALFCHLDANMEPTLFPEEVSERKVCVVGSELVENYTVSCLPAYFAPVSLACS